VPRLRRARSRTLTNRHPGVSHALRSRACRIGFLAGFAGGCLVVVFCGYPQPRSLLMAEAVDIAPGGGAQDRVEDEPRELSLGGR
jgi:hypothetical protein